MAIASFDQIIKDAQDDLLKASSAGKDLLEIQQTMTTAKYCREKHYVELGELLQKLELVECELATGEKSAKSWPEPEIKPNETSESEELSDGGVVLVEDLEVVNADESSDDGSSTPAQSETLVQSSTRGSDSTSDTTSTTISRARRGSRTEVRLKLAIRQENGPDIESKMVIKTEPDGYNGSTSASSNSSASSSSS